MSDHEELVVGGILDEKRLRQIMRRGFLFRNLCVREEEVFAYRNPHDPNKLPPYAVEGATLDNYRDGETPFLVWNEGEMFEGAVDIVTATHEVHVGCGEICPVWAVIPYDGDSGGVPSENAHAIVHAGRDLIDLVREVVTLRSALHFKATDHNVIVLDMPSTLNDAEAARMSHAVHEATGCCVLAMSFPVVSLPRDSVEDAIGVLHDAMTGARAAEVLQSQLEPLLTLAMVLESSAHLGDRLRPHAPVDQAIAAAKTLQRLISLANQGDNVPGRP